MGVRLDQAANVVPAAELRARRMVREAATGRRSRRRKPGRLRLPRGSELRYRRTLVGILSAVEKQVRAEVLPLVEKLTAQVAAGRPDARLDGPTEDFIESVERIREGLSSSILSPSALDAAASEIGSSVAGFNRRDLDRVFEAAIGVGLPATEPGLADVLAGFVADNARRIKNLTNEALDRVESTVLAGFRRGRSNAEIAKGVREAFGVSKRRAKLIARDQVASLNGELTQIRQTRMGVTSYIWRSSRDERVRPSHEDFDGQTFTWAEGSPEGHPGEPINCRCVAEPVLSSIFEGL